MSRTVLFVTIAVTIMVVVPVMVWFLGSANPHTPAGYVGYVYQNAWFGKARFLDLQQGPTSASRGWLYRVVNVSITPFTYDEKFEGNGAVLAKDDLKVEFRLHVVWRVKPDAIQQFVEKYSTLEEGEQVGKVKVEEVAFSH